jgi:hypothetical protein
MAGPSGMIFFARGRSAGVSLRMNCHQMKNSVEITKTTIETYPFSRSPKY